MKEVGEKCEESLSGVEGKSESVRDEGRKSQQDKVVAAQTSAPMFESPLVESTTHMM